MSTRWEIRCVDCDVVGGVEYQGSSSNPGVVLEHIAHADKIAALHLAAEEMRALGLRVEIGESWGGFDGAFFVTHRGHRLVARDEYGHEHGKCARRVLCTCGTQVRCALDDGHEGPCGIGGGSGSP